MIYLAAPYSAHPEYTWWYTLKRTAQLIQEGRVVFSPITHSHEMAIRFDLPGDFEFWAKQDKVFIDRCKEILVIAMPGWETSVGVEAEIKYALSIGKKVTFERHCEELDAWCIEQMGRAYD